MSRVNRFAVLLLLQGCVPYVFSSMASTIPLANGNSWVYAYQKIRSDTTVCYSGTTFHDTVQDTVQNGIFSMSIDSVLVKNDSTFFEMTTIDSGRIIVSQSDTNPPVFIPDTQNYYSKHIYGYKAINDNVLRKDSLSNWLVYNTWFMVFKMAPDSVDNSMGSYQRHSDSINAFSNTSSYMLYFTGKSYSWFSGGGSWYGSDTSLDTVTWIKNFGSPYNELSQRWQNGGIFVNPPECFTYFSAKESWTLVSFNGVPLAITAVLNSASPNRIAPQNKHFIYKKVFLQRGKQLVHKDGISSPYFDLFGRNIRHVQSAQVIIVRE